MRGYVKAEAEMLRCPLSLKTKYRTLKILFSMALKLVCHVHSSGVHDLSCSTKCHVTPSQVATQGLQDN